MSTCRSCGQTANRPWRRTEESRLIQLCSRCNKEWFMSGEKRRADGLVRNLRENAAPEEETDRVLTDGINGRALVDFISRLQKERIAEGRAQG